MIQDEIKKRILILDGAMGTAIQQYGLTEADFRGSEFISHPVNLKGNNECHSRLRVCGDRWQLLCIFCAGRQKYYDLRR